jgi:hypothetical protein
MNDSSQNILTTFIGFDDFLDFLKIRIKQVTFIIISVTFTGSLASLLIPNSYTSSAIVASTKTEETLSSTLKAYSAIASFTGVNIPNEQMLEVDEAIARITSFKFFKNNFLPFIKKEDLAAVKKWDSNNNKLIYKKLFNPKTQEWLKDNETSKLNSPSDLVLFQEYLKLLEITKDDITQLLTISITHKSPYISRDWTKIIIKNINLVMQELDKESAINSIKFLNNEALAINYQSIQQAINSLIEIQLQNLMLASSNDDYVFRIIDDPYLQEVHSAPNRLGISVLSFILGIFISLMYILFYIPKIKRLSGSDIEQS